MRSARHRGRHPHAGRHGVDRAGVDRVQERRVGAVELDQREARRDGRAGAARSASATQRPRLDGAGRADVDEVVGELLGRCRDPTRAAGTMHAVAAADADDPLVGERRHERTDHRPERSLVRELDRGLDDLCHAVSPRDVTEVELMRGDYVRRRHPLSSRCTWPNFHTRRARSSRRRCGLVGCAAT